MMPFILENRDEVRAFCQAEGTQHILGPLEKILAASFHDAATKLAITHDVKVWVSLTDKSLPIPVCGYAPPNEVRIEIDRKQALQIGDELWAWFKSNIYHESSHVKRHLNPGCGNTLEEALVTEGLALCFEEENGAFPFKKLLARNSSDQLKTWAIKAKQEFGPQNAIANGDFYDVDANGWHIKGPVYALGYALVKVYLKDTGQSAAAATQTAADEILPWLNRVIDPAWTPASRPGKADGTLMKCVL